MAHVFHCQAVVQVGFTAMFSAAGRKGGEMAPYEGPVIHSGYTHGL